MHSINNCMDGSRFSTSSKGCCLTVVWKRCRDGALPVRWPLLLCTTCDQHVYVGLVQACPNHGLYCFMLIMQERVSSRKSVLMVNLLGVATVGDPLSKQEYFVLYTWPLYIQHWKPLFCFVYVYGSTSSTFHIHGRKCCCTNWNCSVSLFAVNKVINYHHL